MTDALSYTEAQLRELKKEWEQERQQQDIVRQIAKLEGRLDIIPAEMKTIARAMVIEVLEEQRKRAAEERSHGADRAWSRTSVITQALALLLALALGAAGYFVGRGGISPPG